MKCKDCGRTVDHPSEKLSSICPTCWGLRKEFIEAMRLGVITKDEFRNAQEFVARADGTGANAMRCALGLDSPAI